MRSRYHAQEPDRAYFVTSTIVSWPPVFTTAARCDIPVESPGVEDIEIIHP